MEQTPKLGLPLLQPGQALKHITHNEALWQLDSLTQLSVMSRQSIPPTGAQAGDQYLVDVDAEGDWQGHADAIAQSDGNGGWQMLVPKLGWSCAVLDEQRVYYSFDTGWVDVTADISRAARFGINADADAHNRFIVRSDTVLFDNEGTDHICKVNKNSSSNTSSLQFQTGYTSHAEIGLIGNNNLTLKVSPDGSSWSDALMVESDTAHTRMTNLYSGEIIVLEDAADTIIPPKAGGFMMIMIDGDLYPQLAHAAIIAYDVGTSPNLLSLASGDKFHVTANETLTGTTGPDGFTTVSALNGQLMIENRYGPYQTYRYTFLG